MLTRTARSFLTVTRDAYWIASGLAFGLSALTPIPYLTPITGVFLTYNLAERIGVVRYNRFANAETRSKNLKELVFQHMSTSKALQITCGLKSLHIGMPKVIYEDQGMIGELRERLGRAVEKPEFHLFVNWKDHYFETEGCTIGEGIYTAKPDSDTDAFYFTKLYTYQTFPVGKNFKILDEEYISI